MRYTYGVRIKRRHVALCTCNEKQAPTQWFRDIVTMESRLESDAGVVCH